MYYLQGGIRGRNDAQIIRHAFKHEANLCSG